MVGDIGELLTVLVQFNHDTLARQLQQVFNKLLDLVQEHMSTIWPPAAPLYVKDNIYFNFYLVHATSYRLIL